jgi:hypothetical protein
MAQIISQLPNMVHSSSQAKFTENDVQTLPSQLTHPFYNIIPINIWIWNQTRSHHISPHSSTEAGIEENVSNRLLSTITKPAQCIPFKIPIAYSIFSY